MEKVFRQNKKYTEVEKKEIIEYAQKHGMWTVKEKFNVWPENVRYWLSSEKVKLEISEKSKKRHQEAKLNLELEQKNKEYRKYRKLQGITTAKWKEWYEDMSPLDRESHNQRIKQHRLDNLQHYKAKAKDRYLKDKESGMSRKKYKDDPLHKMRCNIREHIRQAVKYSKISKSHPSIIYLGCSIEEFKIHIEGQFTDGMTWDNHGRGDRCWHLDHIQPLACLATLGDLALLQRICHYSNYQPLWEIDNLSKNSKYAEP